MILIKAAFYRLISSQFICVVYLQMSLTLVSAAILVAYHILLYADDLIILAQQKLLNVCNECEKPTRPMTNTKYALLIGAIVSFTCTFVDYTLVESKVTVLLRLSVRYCMAAVIV